MALFDTRTPCRIRLSSINHFLPKTIWNLIYGEYMLSRKRLTALCVLFLIIASQVFADETQPQPEKSSQPDQKQTLSDESNAIKAMRGLNESISLVKKDIEAQKKVLVGASTEELRLKSENEINTLTARLEQLENNFEGIATGIDIVSFKSPPQTKFDWKQELQDLFTPMIQSMKALTSKPREVEKTRIKVDYLKQKLSEAKTAIANLENRIATTEDDHIKNSLKQLKKKWEGYAQQITSEQSVLTLQIEEKTREEGSIFKSLQDVIKIFFKTRGKNLFLTASGILLVFFTMRFFTDAFNNLVFKIFKDRANLYARFTCLSYQVLTILSAITTGLMILYILGDWTLLGIALLFLLSIAWTAKQTLPKHLVEAKMLLNLGTVKEGERLIYNGIPWKVSALGFYTDLFNPELIGGKISLPINKLADMYSRACHPEEPWFPCRKEDWVTLADGTTGKIVLQSPETVQLFLHGGTVKTYHTPNFLSQNPQNISRGFLIVIPFGLDYSHQKEITVSIPAKMREAVMNGINSAGFAGNLKNLKVEFSKAEASSLDIVIIVSFTGEAAENYGGICRQIQKSAVEACTLNGWSIPFPQVTVHKGL